MHLVTAEEMREMDRRTIEEFGLPARLLMENAGRGTARVLLEKFPDISGKRIGVLAGRGNNGGDGFVAARYLSQRGACVTVYLLTEKSRLTGHAADNFHLLSPLGIQVREVVDQTAFDGICAELAHQQVLVDAILGTGLSAEVKGLLRSVIEFVNAAGRPVVSVDIPSGLHADTGQPCGCCIRASATATFAFPKIGHALMPGASLSGELHVIDIGIPAHIVEAVGPRQHLLNCKTLQEYIKPRREDTHKGKTGHVLIVAGSTGKTGAAALCALSALRAGAGLVTLGIPESVNPSMEPQVLEVMTAPLPETGGGVHSDSAFDVIMKLLSDKQCLAMGPGMGTAAETKALVHRLIQESPVPIVVDADGLNCLAGHMTVLKKKKAEIVLTPHPGEMARLINATPGEVQADRVSCARRFAEKYSLHLVLKGARTVIAHPDGQVHVNPTGNPGMASAGMGDVLTGIIAGFIAQGYPPEHAAPIAVYLHGAAADETAESLGPYGYLASDVMKGLPKAIAGLTGARAYEDPRVYRTPQSEPL